MARRSAKGTKGYGRVKSVKDAARTKPTAANKAAAERTNKAFIERKAKYPGGVRSVVRDSSKVPTWGTDKPPRIVNGKRVSSVVGNTRQVNKPVIRSTAIPQAYNFKYKNAAGREVQNLLVKSRLPSNNVARALKVESNMRALRRAQQAVPMAKLAKAAKVLKPFARVGPLGAGLLMYDAMKGIDKLAKRATGPGGRGYRGQFVDYTSKPTNRGKRGVNY